MDRLHEDWILTVAHADLLPQSTPEGSVNWSVGYGVWCGRRVGGVKAYLARSDRANRWAGVYGGPILLHSMNSRLEPLIAAISHVPTKEPREQPLHLTMCVVGDETGVASRVA